MTEPTEFHPHYCEGACWSAPSAPLNYSDDSMRKPLINAALFLLAWFACVLGGTGPWLLVAVAVLLVHLFWTSSWAEEGKLVVSVFLAGSALDSFLLQLGVFDFGDERQLIPLWLALLWALLGTTLNHSLAWTAKPWWRASLLGAVAGPLSYFGASELADMRLPYGVLPTMIGLAGLWALVLPLLHGFAGLYRQQYRSSRMRG